MVRLVKQHFCILILLTAFIISGLIVYQNGLGIEEYVSKMDRIPIDNQLYILHEGKSMEQVFTTDSNYLVGVELVVVNILENSTGKLVVQLADMWGDLLKEEKVDLTSIDVGIYYRFTFDTELDIENNEEFQLRIYAEDANIPPALVCVYETQDVEENSLCYYDDELIESRLVVGYVFGRTKYIGYQYWERAKIQSTVANVILILLISGGLIYIVRTANWNKLKKKIFDFRIYYQITLISVIFSTFFLCAIINKADTDITIPFGVYAWIIGTALLIGGMCFLYLRRLEQEKKYKQKKPLFLEPYIWIIILFNIVSRLPMFTQIQKWDASAYYGALETACKQFDFTFSSVWNNFRFASHPTFIFALFCAMGEFLVPSRVIGVLIVQLILTTAALICVYCMLIDYWCRMPKMTAMLAVLLLSIIPIFWGTFSIINVDYFLIIFFIFMVYSEYKRLEILRLWWMMAVMLTKETGWVIILGYVLTCLVMLWVREEGSFKDKIRRLSREPLVKIVILSLISVCYYVVVQGSLFSWLGVGVEHRLFVSTEDIKETSIGINAIGFYLPYILHKIAQIFILNFMWIPTAAIIVSGFLLVRKKTQCKGEIRNLESSIGALIFFILFNMLFVTAALSRYTIFSSVLIWIIACILTYYVILPMISWKVSAGTAGAIAIALCVQNFAYIDPLSNLIFLKLDSGKGTILSTDMNLNGYGDTLINNYRFSYVDKLLDKMLKAAGYDAEMQVIALEEKDTYPINGISIYELGWEISRNRRVSLEAGKDMGEIIPIHVLPLSELELNEGESASSKAVVYFLKYCEYDEESYLKRLEPYYEIGERKEISNWGGTLSYYLLERKW